jgi:hypothetical protein
MISTKIAKKAAKSFFGALLNPTNPNQNRFSTEAD